MTLLFILGVPFCWGVYGSTTSSTVPCFVHSVSKSFDTYSPPRSVPRTLIFWPLCLSYDVVRRSKHNRWSKSDGGADLAWRVQSEEISRRLVANDEGRASAVVQRRWVMRFLSDFPLLRIASCLISFWLLLLCFLLVFLQVWSLCHEERKLVVVEWVFWMRGDSWNLCAKRFFFVHLSCEESEVVLGVMNRFLKNEERWFMTVLKCVVYMVQAVFSEGGRFTWCLERWKGGWSVRMRGWSSVFASGDWMIERGEVVEGRR